MMHLDPVKTMEKQKQKQNRQKGVCILYDAFYINDFVQERSNASVSALKLM